MLVMTDDQGNFNKITTMQCGNPNYSMNPDSFGIGCLNNLDLLTIELVDVIQPDVEYY